MGIFDAKRSESSTFPYNAEILTDSRGIRGPPRGSVCALACKRTEWSGGVGGRAVCVALRRVALLLGLGELIKGEDNRRRNVLSGVGDGGDSGRGTRVASLLGINPALTVRGIVPDVILERGDDLPVGEMARTGPVDWLLERDGEVGLLAGGDVVRACEVA